MPDVEVAAGASPDLVKNIPLEMVCDYIGIALDTVKAGDKVIRINFEIDDTNEKRSLVLQNGVVKSRAKTTPDPDLTLRGSGAALNAVIIRGDPAAAVKAGDVVATGRLEALTELVGMLTRFKFWFQIITRPSA